MKIVHISDTHGFHRRINNLPEADLLVHSGDVSMNGSQSEVVDFIDWLCALKGFRHKVWIAGNHDFCLAGASISGMDDNCHYLCNSGIEIDGFKIYGVPLMLQGGLVGNADDMIERIPDDTDILITHQPPLGILDESGGYNFGSEKLLEKVRCIKPKCHLFGHIHGASGRKTIYWSGPGITTQFANSASVNDFYEFSDSPQILNISKECPKLTEMPRSSISLYRGEFEFDGPSDFYKWLRSVGQVAEHGPEGFRRQLVEYLSANDIEVPIREIEEDLSSERRNQLPNEDSPMYLEYRDISSVCRLLEGRNRELYEANYLVLANNDW